MEQRDSYAVLGVRKGATREEIDKRYAELQQLFSSEAIPADLADWSASQREQVQRAYLDLTGQPQEAGPEPAEEYEPPSRSALQSLFDRPLFMAAIGVILGALVLGGFFGIRAWAGKSDGSPPPATAQPTASVDMAKVKVLEGKIKSNPKDEAPMQELGDLYFDAEKWDAAAKWYGKVLEINPKNVNATLDLGTVNFYLNRPDMAKLLWKQVITLDPKNVEAHFNLGIIYSVVEPRDPDAAKEEWQTVLELDPTSQLAEIVRQHQQPPATAESTPAATPAPTP